jgi:DNA-binding response OmpR family regulator
MAAAAMEQAARVLLVDDEPEIVDVMRDFLEADGFRVEIARNGQEGLASFARTEVDCVLLDVMMPGLSGFDLARRIRERSNVPILFLSARDTPTDKIRGLIGGGDDYIVKSATAAEVVARIKAVLRRSRRDGSGASSGTLDFGRLVVDTRRHEVRLDGRVVPLTVREFELLRFFAEHRGQALSREQLFDRVWGGYGDPHTVTVYVKRLREKIEVDPERPAWLATVWGVGYRFEGPR